jgi:signal transduction histidine kinase
MNDALFRYYYTRAEAVAVLLAIMIVLGIACWAFSRRWHRRLARMTREIEIERETRASEYLRQAHDHLQGAIAHSIIEGLMYIAGKSVETLEALDDDQHVLRAKQNAITTKASELAQHAISTLAVFASQEEPPRKELLSIRRLIESVLLELYDYAQSRGVTFIPELGDLEPVFLDKNLTMLVIRNVIQNAVKYSGSGDVVYVYLYLEGGYSEDTFHIDVKDQGKGIAPEDQLVIFEPKRRADGIIEPGSGLGLYSAREAARRQAGDVVLVVSTPNEGSVFRIVFPCRDP